MKYFYEIKDGYVIFIGASKNVPKKCEEINVGKYNELIAICKKYPSRPGYAKDLRLMPDGSCTVTYTEETYDND